MNTLEQAALSGALTSARLSSDPDGREPKRDDETRSSQNPFSALSHQGIDQRDDEARDEDLAIDILNISSEIDALGSDLPHHTSAGNGPGSQMMSRGWSGNTGPKGVLLDFKASHGKSGAILGGDLRSSSNSGCPSAVNPNPSGPHRRQMISSAKKSNRGNRSDSSSASDSDSDKDQRGPAFRHHLSTCSTSSSAPFYATGRQQSGKHFHHKVDSRDKKLFGHLREVGVDNFIQAVEAEKDDRETTVLIHLYDPALESCAILNSHLSNMARLYPRTKFLRALASELDFFIDGSANHNDPNLLIPTIDPSPRGSIESLHNAAMLNGNPFESPDGFIGRFDGPTGRGEYTRRATDSDVLPTLIWYRAGEYVQSLPALEREFPSGLIDRNDETYQELQQLLSRYGVI